MQCGEALVNLICFLIPSKPDIFKTLPAILICFIITHGPSRSSMRKLNHQSSNSSPSKRLIILRRWWGWSGKMWKILWIRKCFRPLKLLYYRVIWCWNSLKYHNQGINSLDRFISLPARNTLIRALLDGNLVSVSGNFQHSSPEYPADDDRLTDQQFRHWLERLAMLAVSSVSMITINLVSQWSSLLIFRFIPETLLCSSFTSNSAFSARLATRARHCHVFCRLANAPLSHFAGSTRRLSHSKSP